MRYGILTFHRAINFGAVLQTLALQRTIQSLGADSEVIDYRSSFIERHYARPRLRNTQDALNLARLVYHGTYVKDNSASFREFASENLVCSPLSYHSRDELVDLQHRYSGFIVGSDQVWNYMTSGFDKAYFLDFVSNDAKKTAYAASFGVGALPLEYVAEYCRLLSGFRSISVREAEGAAIVKSLLDVDVPVVLDPTLLMDSETWRSFESSTHTPYQYILVYGIVLTPTMLRFARRLSRQTGLPLLIHNDGLTRVSGGRNLSRVSPSSWLRLFRNAVFVVTNSFHGLAFSINFEREVFVELLPAPALVNSRLSHSLQMFGLEERLLQDNSRPDSYSSVNFEGVRSILEAQRTLSLSHLRKLIAQ